MTENLRAPSQKLVLQWGRNLKMDQADSLRVSNQLKLRFKLGKANRSFLKKCSVT
jgi:hypothetical protein